MSNHTIKNRVQRRILPIAVGILLLVLGGLAVYRLLYQTRVIVNGIIADQITQLSGIFKKINETCVITEVTQSVGHVNFLNVKSFVSSEVGPLNLAYPKEWRGPYVKDNPSIQGHVYEIVKTKQGYYIVPGTGVKLSSGKIMGKDIIITPTTDIEALITKGPLRHEDKALAAPLPMKGKPMLFDPTIFQTVDA